MSTETGVRPLRVALAGNPNAGKSSIFNALTGGRQHVGNWPGKTVEKKEGRYRRNGLELEIVDLPGAYSLTAFSLEEEIARDFLLADEPDVVISVVDATNVERNLYLVSQILELGLPLVIALNMADLASDRGVAIDRDRLAADLGCPVIPTVATTGEGVDGLAAAVVDVARAGPGTPLRLDYGWEVEDELHALTALVGDGALDATGRPARWLALALLEGDDKAYRLAGSLEHGAAVQSAAAAAASRIEAATEETAETLIVDRRYAWINGLVRDTVHHPADRKSLSDRVDRILAGRVLGIPFFLAAMWVVFKLTTDVAGIYLDWIDGTMSGPVTRWAAVVLGWLGLDGGWLESLVVDGVIAGVGGVLVFVPVLVALYTALAVLEDSGYMARAAFIMDRVMHRLGLHGKSFLPMLVGFGCTVPAIYATRTLSSEKDRILTGLLVPFMSCGARLPVYILFAAVFFPAHRGTVVFAMYLTGIATAMVLGIVLKQTLFRGGEPVPFVMELPPYRLPSWRSIRRHTWQRTAAFLRSAATLILVASVAVWLLLSIPVRGGEFADTAIDDSAFAVVAETAAPVFSPLGFGTWEATGALASGFVAKEVVVSTAAQVYGDPGATAAPGGTGFVGDLGEIGESFIAATWDVVRSVPGIVGIDLIDEEAAPPVSESLIERIHVSFDASSGGHPAAAGLAFMVFVLLYTPCVAAVAAARHELGTRWMWTSVIGQLAIAWTGALVVFQAGVRLGGG